MLEGVMSAMGLVDYRERVGCGRVAELNIDKG